jgi:hypothetical protein
MHVRLGEATRLGFVVTSFIQVFFLLFFFYLLFFLSDKISLLNVDILFYFLIVD